MRPTFDEKDSEILTARKNAFNTQREVINRPMVGDYIRFSDGTFARFTHDWNDSLQTTVYRSDHPCLGDSSFYLGEGYASFSGSLAPSIPLANIKPTDAWKDASFWFFHHNWATAHNGVHFTMPVKIYELID